MAKGDKTEQPRTRVGKEAMLAALRKTMGIVTPALEQTGTGRATYYSWLKDDPDFKAKVEELNEVALDFVEGQQFVLMRGTVSHVSFTGEDGEEQKVTVHKRPPCQRSIWNYLRTKGRSRGYNEVNEVVNYTPDAPPKWFNGEEIEQ